MSNGSSSNLWKSTVLMAGQADAEDLKITEDFLKRMCENGILRVEVKIWEERPLLRATNRAKRLGLAQEHERLTVPQGKNVVFGDDSTFTTAGDQRDTVNMRSELKIPLRDGIPPGLPCSCGKVSYLPSSCFGKDHPVGRWPLRHSSSPPVWTVLFIAFSSTAPRARISGSRKWWCPVARTRTR